MRKNRRYCEMCDEWFPLKNKECPKCGMPMEAHAFCAACDREAETAGGYLTDEEGHACQRERLRKEGRRGFHRVD